MHRISFEKLRSWKASVRRKPLILRGARQVGKTWLVERFAQEAFDDFLKIDLEKDYSLRKLFSEDLSPHKIVAELEAITNHKIIPGQTLLFIDEIQNSPRALTALRYFYEEMPQLHLISAGSLLEFALDTLSFPVGRVQFMDLHPMNFREFLIASQQDLLAEKLSALPDEISPILHEKLLALLKIYFFVGGMPECVKVYLETNSLLEAFAVQSEIITAYRQDFSKYAQHADHTCLNTVLNSVSGKIGEQIKYTELNHQHTGPTNHKAFDLLCKARVLYKIPCCNPSGLPLGGDVNEKKFKACLLDIGLMQCLAQIPYRTEIQQDDLLALYRGKLAEQFVAQELLSVADHPLYFWARDARSSQAEVDFIHLQNGKIVPLEVKSGKGGSLRSLHRILEDYPNLEKGIVLNSGLHTKLPAQKLEFIPLYKAGSL